MSEYITTVTTDSNGTATVNLDTGTYEIEFTDETGEYDSETVTVGIEDDRTITQTLESDVSPTPPTQDETTTDADGEFELFLDSGDYTFVADHADYWAEVLDVEIDDDEKQLDLDLDPYGDRIDTAGLGEIETLTTDSAGEGAFEEVLDGDYVLEFEHDDYRTKTLALEHTTASDEAVTLQADDLIDPPDEDAPSDPSDPPSVGSPEGFDPHLTLPDGDPHFEVAVLDTDAGGDFLIPILVSNTGGETGATDLRIELDIDGEVIDRRELTLVSGGYTIAQLSVRSFVEQSSVPASMRVSSLDDEMTFELTATIDPRPIENRGRPTTLGGTATLGDAAPATLGPVREPLVETGIDAPDEGWAIVLERVNGERRTITTLLDDPDIEDTHTELSSWSVDVPADPSLAQWDYQTRAYITRDGRPVNIGWCDSVESDASNEVTTLSGAGPLYDLTGDEYEVEIHQSLDWRAAEKIVGNVATDWDITVVRPADPLLVEDESYSGSALDILTSFCEDYGLFLRPSQTQFGEATIYEPGGVARTAEMAILDYTESASSEGYANEIEFVGDDVRETVPDDDEIRRLAEERDIRLRDARETIRIEDDSVESARKARSKAQSELRERIRNLDVGGSIETPARRLLPGVTYPLPGDDEAWHGARSLQLQGDGSVELPPALFGRLSTSGAAVFAVRATHSELRADEGRLFGAFPGSLPDHAVFTHERTLEVGVYIDDDTTARADPFGADDDLPVDDDWHLVHYDWEFDPATGETVVRAGHDGVIGETTTVPTEIELGDVENAAIGRAGTDFLREAFVDSARFFDRPQSTDRYAALGRGESVPAADLVSRFVFEEPRDESTAYDDIGGYHGTREGDVRVGGQTATLESADHGLTTTSAEFDTQVTVMDALRDLQD